MNFINKLFWSVKCEVRPFNKATLAYTATLTFTHKFRNELHTFNLSESEYVQYVNEPKVIVDKYFKKISK